MNTRLIGLVVGSVGVFCLILAMIFGIVIGVNERTQMNHWIEGEDVSEEDYDKASESNAFLMPTNMGLAGFGMGMVFIGIGLALAGAKKGNIIVMAIAFAAVLILFIGLILSVYEGAMDKESEKIGNDDDASDSDEKRQEEIAQKTSFLSPFNYFFSGFMFGSLGMGLALATVLLGAFITAGSGDGAKPQSMYGGGAGVYSPSSNQASTPSGATPPGAYNPTQEQSGMDQIFS